MLIMFLRYWAQDIYDTNSAFGASSDLVALSAAVHDLGMVGRGPVGREMGWLTCCSISWLML